jgi:hypothetical protein
MTTDSIEQSPSTEANSHSASQEIPLILWNPKVHCRDYRRSYVFSLFLMAFSDVGISFCLWIPETFGRTPWAGDQSSTKASTYIGQHNTQKHIHAPSRIRTCDPNVRAAEDSNCLRLRS